MGKGFWRRWGVVAFAVLAALGSAELGARVVRHDAFPYLNIFVADEALGVRLSADERASVRSAAGNVTEVRTNAIGLRGPAWPSGRGARPRVLVLGDSQALGLHVPWERTFAARLAPRFDVVDAAVPTWGPPEYQLVLDEQLARGRPDAVVYVVNVANDFSETVAPNRLRTTAEDGWAVRPTGAPPEPFPGRAFLFGRSHLVYAVRQVLGHVTSVPPLRADSARRLVADLGELGRAPAPYASRLGPFLADAKQSCDRADARLVVAVLPLDVQVHSREWAKYRAQPIDLRATEALADGVVADANVLGVAVVDLLPALRRSSPGAFLPDDPHLSARGHGAVARALTPLLQAPTETEGT